MYLTLRVYRNGGDKGGFLELVRRKSPTCFKSIGGIFFEDEDDLKYLLDAFRNEHPGNTIEERAAPYPDHCPLCNYTPPKH